MGPAVPSAVLAALVAIGLVVGWETARIDPTRLKLASGVVLMDVGAYLVA
ncbi:hypothetical protein [Halopelagius fulvigenes]|uniref:Uncharacterized protein n=1 Tax=Halopelagius fulvigenes TaxID=1198324 RepID=A0ABD5U5B7_9EURY